MGILERVANEVAAAIGGVVDYVPEYELKDFQKEKRLVYPLALEFSQVSRERKEIIVSLEVGVFKRIREDELPAMLEFMEDTVQQLQNLAVFDGRGYNREVLNSPAYSMDAMAQAQVFASVLQVKYRIV